MISSAVGGAIAGNKLAHSGLTISEQGYVLLFIIIGIALGFFVLELVVGFIGGSLDHSGSSSFLFFLIIPIVVISFGHFKEKNIDTSYVSIEEVKEVDLDIRSVIREELQKEGLIEITKKTYTEYKEDKPIIQEVNNVSSTENLEDTIKRLITEEKEIKEEKTYTEDELRELIKNILNENN